MTICIPHIKVKSIPSCIGEVTIGKITDASISVAVYIKDDTTGKLIAIQSSSNGSGDVVVDLTGYEFAQNHSYSLWITKANVSQDDRETITVGTETGEIISIRFEDITEGGESFSLPTITLVAA